jgi:hypothetical protein
MLIYKVYMRILKFFLLLAQIYIFNTTPKEIIKYIQNHQNGIYCVNPEESKNTIMIEKSFYHCGIIEKITWKDCLIPLEEVQKKFPSFQQDKSLNILELKNILFFLKSQTGIVFNLNLLFSSEGKVTVILEKKIIKPYFISRIYIKNNHILTKKKILEHIKDSVSILNIFEKIKYLFSHTFAQVSGYMQIYMITQKIQELSEKNFILNTQIQISFQLDPYTNDAVVYIHIEEGHKYFLKDIILNQIKFKKSLIKDFVNSHGFQNGSFDYLKAFLLQHKIYNTHITYEIIDDLYINLIITKIDNQNPLFIENIVFTDLEFDSNILNTLNYLQLGDIFDEQKAQYFCELLSFLYGKKFSFDVTTSHTHNKNKVVLIIKTEENKDNNQFITMENSMLKFQYPLFYIPNQYPYLKINLMPSLFVNFSSFNLGLPSFFNLGLELTPQLKYIIQDYHCTFNIINGKAYFAYDHAKFLKSFKLQILQGHIKKKDIEYDFALLNMNKYFHKCMKEDLQKYIYYYSYFSASKIWHLRHDYRIELKPSCKIFYNDFSLKCSINPSFYIPLWDKFALLSDIKCIWNTADTKQYFKHLAAINNKHDDILGLFWRNDIPENFEFPENVKEHHSIYIHDKGIILSKFLVNFRTILLYNIFSLPIPQIGIIKIFLCIFFMLCIDAENKNFRISYGIGCLGNYSHHNVMFVLGYKRDLSNFAINQGLQYDFKLEQSIL